MAIQKNQEYYLGLDIGTDSVGYAVTGTDYCSNTVANLCGA